MWAKSVEQQVGTAAVCQVEHLGHQWGSNPAGDKVWRDKLGQEVWTKCVEQQVCKTARCKVKHLATRGQ